MQGGLSIRPGVSVFAFERGAASIASRTKVEGASSVERRAGRVADDVTRRDSCQWG
jgi:hypothetical protein